MPEDNGHYILNTVRKHVDLEFYTQQKRAVKWSKMKTFPDEQNLSNSITSRYTQ